MPEELMNELVKTLRTNKDLFAWKVIDILGIDPNVISHKLSLCREAKLILSEEKEDGGREKKGSF